MTRVLDRLIANVLARSDTFAQKLRASVPSTIYDVGHYSTEAFLLRAYVSLRSDNDGDGLAMTVDIRAQPETGGSSLISIESGLCRDNGAIVATGPGAKFDASSSDFEVAVSSWIRDFDVFLKGSEVEAITVLKTLIASKNKASREASLS